MAKYLSIEVLRADPKNESAWLSYVDSLDSDIERVKTLDEFLRLNPQSQTIKARFDNLLLNLFNELNNAWQNKDWQGVIQNGQAILLLHTMHIYQNETRSRLAVGFFFWDKIEEKRYFTSKDIKTAILDMNQLVRNASERADYYWMRGILLSKRSQYQKKDLSDLALLNYSEAIKFDPTQSIYYWYRGMCLMSKLDYDKALIDLQKTIDLDPTNLNFQLTIGQYYLKRKEFEKALLIYNQIIDSDPTNSDYYYWRCLCNRELKFYECAMTDLDKVIELNPANIKYHYLREDLIHEQVLNKRIEALNKAIEIDPRNGNLYSERGKAYESSGRTDLALEDYFKAAEINPARIGDFNRLSNSCPICSKNDCVEKLSDIYNRFHKVLPPAELALKLPNESVPLLNNEKGYSAIFIARISPPAKPVKGFLESQERYKNKIEFWAEQKQIWNRLLYCRRDNIVFDLYWDRPRSCQPEDIDQLINS